MNDKTITGLVTIAIGLVGVAVIAVLVAPGALTAKVFGAGGGALGQALCVALSPVLGSSSCGVSNVSSTINYGNVPIPTSNSSGNANSTVTYPGTSTTPAGGGGGCFNDPNTGVQVCPPG